MLDMQNVKELAITEGDVRTIHDSNDNLLWGRLAYDTKYAGDTTQQTYSGKNLYAGSQDFSGTWGNSSSWTTDTETYNGLVVKYKADAWNGLYKEIGVESGKTYTFSAFIKAGSARDVNFYLGGGSATVSPASKSISITTEWQRYSVTFTASVSGTVRGRVENTSNQTTPTYVCGYQLEESESMTTYEPYTGGIPAPNPDYPQPIQVVTGEQTVTVSDGVNSDDYTISLGTIELCKIGTYQDYIYKSGDDWYVHKDLSKQVLNGTENIYNKDTSSGFTRIHFPLTGQANVGSNHNTNIRSDYFNASDTNNYGTVFLNNARTYVYPQSTITTVEEFKTWLESHNTTFYYPLATPTDTQITDTTLLEQLDAVHEWLTRYGYSSNVTGNLPIIINQTNL